MANVTIQLEPAAASFQGTAFPALVRNGANFPVFGLAYDAATDEAAFWDFRAVNYASGNLAIDVDWYADTAVSGDVVWESQLAAITPNTDTQDVETKTLATLNTVTDTHLGTTGQRLHRCTITATNLDSLTVDDVVWLRLARDANNVADTMAGDAILVKVTVTYLST